MSKTAWLPRFVDNLTKITDNAKLLWYVIRIDIKSGSNFLTDFLLKDDKAPCV